MMASGPCYQLSSHKFKHHLAALKEFLQSVEKSFLSFFFLLCVYNIVSLLTIKLKARGEEVYPPPYLRDFIMKDSLKKNSMNCQGKLYFSHSSQTLCFCRGFDLHGKAEAIVCVRLSAIASYSSLTVRRSNVLMKTNMMQILCSRVRINKINIIGLILQVKALLLLIFNALLCIDVLVACAVAGLEQSR